MTFSEILNSHSGLESRRQNSEESLTKIREHFSRTKFFDNKPVSVFTAGSFGRRDAGKKSDLDLFVVAEDDKRSRLSDLEILAKLIQINSELNYPPFSNDGQYLKVYSIADMKHKAGDPNDDSENLFTARLLFLLESTPLCNEVLYQRNLKGIIEHYFREYPDHKPFSPLFLLNDILRYWRTLCLNYELIRNDRENDRPWRKKNINLKFSRMLTVFATVLPLIAIPVRRPEELDKLAKSPPLVRLARGLDALGDTNLESKFTEFLDDYEQFLRWKEQEDVEKAMQKLEIRQQARDSATRFSNFLYTALTHEKIPIEFRKYLVI